ncbi:hypothetical protein EES45_24700 [Streptomyces sp. ADI97-07]|uniref:hypothetical protein n=1 Tax=Streptomyces sp. ADI97-07 TaxID=1522762 RepID=UPI000F552686|nr:hypothetical protein [Streptomyces sp. ADI97-07]RPK75690.1 hypothetical protein EES45_24700 [Streptomyces sp. ADI97-07]
MTTFDLAPGLITTRAEVAAVYGGSIHSGGIVVANESKMVFIYSDPSAGEEHGYTFDGRAQDDQFGPLYHYTGAGRVGDQQMTDRNKSLRDHAASGRSVHLFVADGKVENKGETLQRYIGQVAVDPVLPVVERHGPDREGALRRLFVFRLRPAEGALLAWTDKDNLKPATQNTIVEVPTPSQTFVPAQTKAKPKKTEQHKTAETTATIAAGVRVVKRREGQLVTAFEAHLVHLGHTVKSFQLTVEGEPDVLLPDLYDETDHVLYEAKGLTTRPNVRMAIGQLADYRRHMPDPKTLRVAVLLPSEPSPDVEKMLAAENVTLVYQTADGFEGLPVPVA